jgi:hypothetical protein
MFPEDGWSMSIHAAQRAVEMCLPARVIGEVINHPERTYPALATSERDPRYVGQDRTVYVKGKLAIVVATRDKRIITIVWSGIEVDRKDLSKTWDGDEWMDY